jgi:hypothetical protein
MNIDMFLLLLENKNITEYNSVYIWNYYSTKNLELLYNTLKNATHISSIWIYHHDIYNSERDELIAEKESDRLSLAIAARQAVMNYKNIRLCSVVFCVERSLKRSGIIEWQLLKIIKGYM